MSGKIVETKFEGRKKMEIDSLGCFKNDKKPAPEIWHHVTIGSLARIMWLFPWGAWKQRKAVELKTHSLSEMVGIYFS